MFENCGLESIIVESGNTTYDSRNDCNAIIETASNTLISGCKNTVIPSSVTTIGEKAFYHCFGLTSIVIPNSVTSIEYSAFSECTDLVNVSLGTSLKSIGQRAFGGCSGLNNLVLPNTLTSIGNFAFNGCSSLIELTIPDGITTIGWGTFAACTGLTNVNFGNSVTTIEERAFEYYLKLTSLSLPNSLTTIGPWAFSQCTALASVTIPSSVTRIYDEAFWGCSGLKEVYSYITDLSQINMGLWVFVNDDGYAGRTLYVPACSLDAYMADEWWSMFFENIEVMGHCLIMNDATMFQGKTITLPVKMNRAATFGSIQVNISMPEGLEVAKGNSGYLIKMSDRLAQTHSIMNMDMANGDICVMCYPRNGGYFNCEEGEVLFNITVKAADDVQGDRIIWLDKGQFTTPDGDLLRLGEDPCTVKVVANSDIPGDVNNDAALNINDATVLIDILLGGGDTFFSADNADYNNDGVIDIADVTALLDALL